MSLDLLSVMSDRTNYDRFSRFIKPSTLPKEAKTLMADIGEWFKEHPNNDYIDWDMFGEWFRIVRHSNYKEEQFKSFDRIIERLDGYEPTELHDAIIQKYIAQDYCKRIADVALQGAEGGVIDMSDISTLVDGYNDETQRALELEKYIVGDSIKGLVEEVMDHGYDWRLDCLNKSIGNLRKGKLVCFAARPNTGKTTWLASEATFIASQIPPEKDVIWFNNEEAGADVRMRIYQAALKKDDQWIRKNIDDVERLYGEAVNGGINKIKVIDLATLSVKDAEEILRNYNPGLIIFDQLWKVHGFEKSQSDTARLGSIFQWAREISKQYAPVITVHQVKTEGEGVKVLDQSMLYMSGTIVQGEVDSLLMMGRAHDDEDSNKRYIHVAKNKGAYGNKVDKKLNEATFVANIHPDIATFTWMG